MPATRVAAQTTSPQERIAAMKALAAAKDARRKAARVLAVRRGSLEGTARDALAAALKDLAGIPVVPNGVVLTQVDVYEESWRVCVSRKGWQDADGEDETVYEPLISFLIFSDREASEAWVTHDGSRIDEATALDLATAVVEARFDG